MSAVVPTKPPSVAFRNVFELAADYGVHFERLERREKNTMILYNTIVGLAAGAGLLRVAQLLQTIRQWRKSAAGGLRFDLWHHRIYSDRPGLTISVMWPYTKVLHANIMLGEPAAGFRGIACGSIVLSLRRREIFNDLGTEMKDLLRH